MERREGTPEGVHAHKQSHRRHILAPQGRDFSSWIRREEWRCLKHVSAKRWLERAGPVVLPPPEMGKYSPGPAGPDYGRRGKAAISADVDDRTVFCWMTPVGCVDYSGCGEDSAHRDRHELTRPKTIQPGERRLLPVFSPAFRRSQWGTCLWRIGLRSVQCQGHYVGPSGVELEFCRNPG